MLPKRLGPAPEGNRVSSRRQGCTPLRAKRTRGCRTRTLVGVSVGYSLLNVPIGLAGPLFVSRAETFHFLICRWAQRGPPRAPSERKPCGLSLQARRRGAAL